MAVVRHPGRDPKVRDPSSPVVWSVEIRLASVGRRMDAAAAAPPNEHQLLRRGMRRAAFPLDAPLLLPSGPQVPQSGTFPSNNELESSLFLFLTFCIRLKGIKMQFFFNVAIQNFIFSSK